VLIGWFASVDPRLPGVGTLFALLSSLMWGTSDFLGGTTSRRLPPLAVVVVSEFIGLLGPLVYAVATGALDSSPGYVGWALMAAVAGSAGILAFYHALATGTMGVIAPIAALGVVVPVAVGLGQGDRPSALQGIGIAVAIIGVVLASGPELRGAEGSRRAAALPLILAGVAALGFGLVFVALEHGAQTSTAMTLVVMRSASVVLLLVVGLSSGRSQLKVGVRDLPVLAVVGGFDVGANATFAYASEHGLLSVVSVLSSLYPAVTVILARSVHSERLRGVQIAGVLSALAGVCLIASASA
jgi:drug/metabolite transporter (DMT)-like permease